MNETRYTLRTLETMLSEQGKNAIYPCIMDLVEHGLVLTRFSTDEFSPNLQDITQYLAAWSRHTGLSEEESREWLIDYSISIGSSLSKRTPAAVRHSTKSILKYIYRSSIPFYCQCDKNSFKAHCSGDCPVYTEMQTNLSTKAGELLYTMPVLRVQTTVFEPVLPLKEAYREQFDTALRIAHEEAQKGTNLRGIVAILNNRGLKTRTGRQWKDAILRNELKRIL